MTNFGKDYTFRFNNQKVYVLLGNPDLTWQEAESTAQSLGGHLVTINDATENRWIVENFGTDPLWIGLNDVEQEGVFQWSSGEPVTYTNWASYEPNNHGGNQNYAYINYQHQSGLWDDGTAEQQLWGLAEIDFSGNAPEIISNGGAAEVSLEITTDTNFVIDIDAIDADGDTEGNGLHYSIAGGNSANAFTIDANTGELSFQETPDSDILYDVEIKVSDSGQLEFAHLPHGAKFYNGHAYVVLDNPHLTWHQAQAHAQSLGGNLVTINDAAEEEWIKHAFSAHHEFWIGLNDEAHEGDFQWVSGEAVTYTNWASYEPNNYLGNQDYAVMNWGAHRQWDDQGSDAGNRAIVEIAPTRGESLMDTQRILVTVIDNNQVPVAIDDSAIVESGAQVGIRVLNNDFDPDGDAIRIDFPNTDRVSANEGIIRWNQNGTFDDFSDDRLVYRPAAGFVGTDTFEYAIADGRGGTATATVTIIVVPGNETLPPIQQKITLEGTDNNDLLVAESSQADYDIRGLAGNDTMIGNAGNDCLVGGSGNDDLFGDSGNDTLDGTDAVNRGIGEWDVLMGGEGEDTFILGDEDGSYYLGNGTSDFALIKDFDIEEDELVLAGSIDDYEFRGNEIYLNDDLVVSFIGFQTSELTTNDFEDGIPDQVIR